LLRDYRNRGVVRGLAEFPIIAGSPFPLGERFFHEGGVLGSVAVISHSLHIETMDGLRENRVISFGPFRVSKARRKLERNGEPLQIGSRAFDILTRLLEHPGQIVSHRDLLEAAWPGTNVEDGSLRFQMTALRKVLGDGETKYIVSVSGRGYCFAAPVAQSEEREPSPLAQVRANWINRPPQPTRLVGRAQSVIELCNLVRSHRIVSVVGSGGLGKSSIAVAAISQIDALFGDGCCFIDLGRVENPERVTDALAVALGIPVRSVNSVDEIIPILQHRQMLIVIDGCEHVIEAAATLVEKIVAATASIHILATSREALRIEHERVFALEALATPPIDRTLSAEEIMAYPAPQLLAEKTQATKGAVSSDAEARLIAQICAKLDGLPLAIELAASQANVFGFDTIARMLDDQFSLAWPGRRTAPPRHQTLGAMLDWSYRLLAEEEKRTLRALSVFSGDFSLEAARAIAVDEVAGGAIMPALAELVSKSLLSVTRSESRMRYRLLDTTRNYARGKLVEAGELDGVRRQHGHFYQQAVKNLATNELDRDRLGDLADDIEDIRAAIVWALSPSGESALAVNLVVGALPLWNYLSLYREAKTWTTKVLGLAEKSDDLHTVLALQEGLARAVAYTSGYGEEFREAWSRGRDIAKSLGRTDGEALAILNLWSRQVALCNISEAQEYATLFWRFGESETSPWRGMAHWLEGTISHIAGNYADARVQFQKAIAENRPAALDLQCGLFGYDCQAISLATLSNTCLMEGDVARAVELSEAALKKALEEGRDFEIAMSELSAVANFVHIGNLERAGALARDLQGRCKKGSLAYFANIANAHISTIDAWLGSDESLHRLGEDISQLQRQGSRIYVDRFSAERLSISTERRRKGEILQALEPLDATAMVGTSYLAEAIRLNGRLLALAGNHSEAERQYLAALQIAQRQPCRFWELRAASDLADHWINNGRAEEARSLLEAIVAQWPNGTDTKDLVRARALLKEPG
jgi:predicted ATPase/DNA-binding winged helix-turn-helix (wHTH) protein